MQTDKLYIDSLNLLKQLIATPSFSKEEENTAAIIESFLQSAGVTTNRFLNNVWAVNRVVRSNKTNHFAQLPS